jgi:hypothetical protein
MKQLGSYLDPKAASEYLKERYDISMTPKSLANRRHLGLAPKFVRLARRWPRYTPEWLDEFADPPQSKQEDTVAGLASERPPQGG